MPTRLLLLLSALAVLATSCGGAGKTLAGGQGDPSLFDVVPPVPSVPVQLGTYVVRVTKIDTNPPNLLDQYQSLKDTTTITLSAGPSGSQIQLKGEYLDPRINDAIYLRDRGRNQWSAINQAGGFTETITTDPAGSPQTFIIGTTSTSTLGGSIQSKRTFSFGFPLPGAVPGLWWASCNVDDNPGRDLDIGDVQYFCINSIGVAQWEHDYGTSLVHYFLEPPVDMRGQFTQFHSVDSPANIEEEDILYMPFYLAGGQRNETNHVDQQHVQTYGYFPSPPHIVNVISGGTWTGLVANTGGVYLGAPYNLRNNQSSVSFTINQGLLHVNLTEGAVTNVLNIIAITGTDLIAVRAIGTSGYEYYDLFRNVNGTIQLSQTPGDNLTVTTYGYGVNGNPDQILGSYTVPVLSQ